MVYLNSCMYSLNIPHKLFALYVNLYKENQYARKIIATTVAIYCIGQKVCSGCSVRGYKNPNKLFGQANNSTFLRLPCWS